MKPHVMELPRLIEVGEKTVGRIGKFLTSLGKPKMASLISGENVRGIVGRKIERSLRHQNIKLRWHTVTDNRTRSISSTLGEIRESGSDIIAGIGGGRSVDIAKLVSHRLGIPFVSIPTAASHDGMASPFASVRSNRPHSIMAAAPMGIFVDIDIIKSAPPRLMASGCGDLVANIVAVRDWQLGNQKTGEYYGVYSSNLATMSAMIVMENAAEFSKNGLDARIIVEGLISAGVASCIAGSSRPCSGSEHLFSHAINRVAPGIGLHGEICGLGSIMMTKLQGRNWKKIARTLRRVGAPTTAKQIGLEPSQVVEALVAAQSMRPERYTILHEVDMTENFARNLARSTDVI